MVKICIYLEPMCPLFWWLNAPKQGLFQSKQGSFEFQVYIYITCFTQRLPETDVLTWLIEGHHGKSHDIVNAIIVEPNSCLGQCTWTELIPLQEWHMAFSCDICWWCLLYVIQHNAYNIHIMKQLYTYMWTLHITWQTYSIHDKHIQYMTNVYCTMYIHNYICILMYRCDYTFKYMIILIQ